MIYKSSPSRSIPGKMLQKKARSDSFFKTQPGPISLGTEPYRSLVLILSLFVNFFFEQVMVHTPETFPDVATAYKVHAVPKRITRISVSVAQVEADSSLDRLDSRNGQCYMYNAKATKVSPTFHKSSDEDTCYIKCRMKAIHTACNCTQYFFKLYKGQC